MNCILIIGAAPCAPEDIRHAAEIIRHAGEDYHVMCIGKTASAVHKPDCKYLATYHPVQLPEIRAQRAADGCNTDYIVIAHETKWPEVAISLPLQPGERSGSSALLGALAALREGYTRIILCGCPMTGKNANGGDYDTFQIGWRNKQKFLNDRVRSMSGWTRELLGAPTDEWLTEAR